MKNPAATPPQIFHTPLFPAKRIILSKDPVFLVRSIHYHRLSFCVDKSYHRGNNNAVDALPLFTEYLPHKQGFFIAKWGKIWYYYIHISL